MNIFNLTLALCFPLSAAIAAGGAGSAGPSASPIAFDLFGGFSYLNAYANSYPRQSLRGWEGGVAVGANRWIGGEASAFGYYKNFYGTDRKFQGVHAGPRVNAGPMFIRLQAQEQRSSWLTLLQLVRSRQEFRSRLIPLPRGQEGVVQTRRRQILLEL